LTEAAPQAGAGIDAGLLGTTARDDGPRQVTYNGHPLYFYAHEGRDEVRCHNVPGFGGTWLALNAEGNALD
jgi:predicted lipoprotein with Yx(FWY)xxD motif